VTPDAEWCERLRAGDRSVVPELLRRDHAAAVFFAHVMDASDPQRTVATAWEELLAAMGRGAGGDDLRVGLFGRLAAAVGADGRTADRPDTRPDRPGTFVGPDDRWEGWWDREPTAWPASADIGPARVAAAVRRLPVNLRGVLVLRDVADLTAEQTSAVLPAARSHQATMLESARDAYLIALDREVTGR
jgi:hypothetical protein